MYNICVFVRVCVRACFAILIFEIKIDRKTVQLGKISIKPLNQSYYFTEFLDFSLRILRILEIFQSP